MRQGDNLGDQQQRSDVCEDQPSSRQIRVVCYLVVFKLSKHYKITHGYYMNTEGIYFEPVKFNAARGGKPLEIA